MNIAYFTDIRSIHGHSWISHFASAHRTILICEKDPAGKNLYENDSRITVYPVLPKTYPLRNFAERNAAVREVKKILRDCKTDIAHSMYALPYAFWPWHARFPRHIATTRGSDVLVHFRNNREKAKTWKEKLIHAALDRRMIRSLDAAQCITCTSTQQEQVIRTMVRNHAKIHLVRTGVDTRNFLAHCKGTQPAGPPVLLSNRAMTPLYNIHLLVEAFALLKKSGRFPGMRMIVLNYQSDPAYFERVKKTVADEKLENEIEFREKQNPQELAALYDQCHAVLMAPEQDGSPVSGVETLLARKPLLLPPLDYDKQVFGPGAVWHFRDYSAASIAESISEILAKDKNELEQKTKPGFDAAMLHADRDSQLAKVEELYRHMMKNPRA
ncbi:MAG: glycosyltransferase 1 protein [Bacteroidetes bacterium]|nr:MAG: glycosyltransferase 1 protein [Bacteroidota bacterium]